MSKRLFDIVASALGLLLLSPLILIIAWKVRQKLGSPIFFRQTRPGLHGKPFQMVKFRTMRDAYDVKGNSLPDSERITPFGKFLRSTSLDELPELWNVLKGDMSIVGPRPLLTKYLELYTLEEARRHEVKPGVTGLAQVKGRNTISWEERFEYDVYYVDNHSLLLDIKIIAWTLLSVMTRRGVIADPGLNKVKKLSERAIGGYESDRATGDERKENKS